MSLSEQNRLNSSENILEQPFWTLADKARFSRSEVQRSQLIYHDNSCHRLSIWNLDVERVLALRIAHRADKGKTNLAIKINRAYHQCWTITHLLMPNLWVKAQTHEISTFWNVCHQTSSPIGRPQSTSGSGDSTTSASSSSRLNSGKA
ncbi:hypothetical protein NIES3806_13540 [Microcystis aeruginosa NIES-3806]|uniref:Uncharacterized protein n=2 Tax=Microcystis aeruginosa TaxID=1126 RepID=A0A6H9FNZ5_MICAE|nr:hypothetical protein NIES3787_03150 [Microcystis aeruginosa NIES-3787]GCL54017.1 hypothetical protein NIES3806_13540 [Microcystis aeruginosa NIES-3806]GCL58739.1 hypothetical protein NIES3807_19090 [Microcystis aeruginosa NIES-3807]